MKNEIISFGTNTCLNINDAFHLNLRKTIFSFYVLKLTSDKSYFHTVSFMNDCLTVCRPDWMKKTLKKQAPPSGEVVGTAGS